MATYAVGDVQGCFDALQRLLDKINFDQSNDTLWFAGDLVNRGSQSLKTLQFVKSLGDSAVTVLGNHDIHLLALYYGLRPKGKDPTLDHVLAAPDCDELITWLQQQPLLHVQDNFALVHAGLHPSWTLDTAIKLATELNNIISQLDSKSALTGIYGNSEGSWEQAAESDQRLKFALNCFTRLRFCNKHGVLDFKHSCAPGQQPNQLLAWFNMKNRPTEPLNIIFGHWAALGVHRQPGIYALDSGCVWGKALTALRLSDLKTFAVDCG